MPFPLQFLLLSFLQVLLLVGVVFRMILWWLRDGIRLSLTDFLLLCIQLINIAVIMKYCSQDSVFMPFFRKYPWFMPLIQVFLVIVIALRFLFLLRKIRQHPLELRSIQAIRETVNSLPAGLCIAMPDGRPVLVNHRMNDLVYTLLGSTVINANRTWESLSHVPSRLKIPWLTQIPAPLRPDGQLIIALSDGTIWSFSRCLLTNGFPNYIQLEATEITALYQLSEQLYKNNQRLSEQFRRQEKLLDDIVQINRQKELLAFKVKIHDEFGRCLLVTKQHLERHKTGNSRHFLIELWRSALRNFSNIPEEQNQTSPDVELRKVAELIGCTIDIQGDPPADRSTALLLYAAIREALTNALRHANANRLTVICRHTTQNFHVEISDNGNASVSSISEGDGLKSLRTRLEQEGALLNFQFDHGVTMLIDFPLMTVDPISQEVIT